MGAAPQTRPDPATATFKATDFDSLLENDFTALDPAAQPKRVAAISDCKKHITIKDRGRNPRRNDPKPKQATKASACES